MFEKMCHQLLSRFRSRQTLTSKMTGFNVKITLLLINFSWQYVSCNPLVEIPQGRLEGTFAKSSNGREFSSFLGIPYAQPPIESLRFKNPVPAKSWMGLRKADKDANMCPQLNGTHPIGNEDCLYLNVFTPFKEFNAFLQNKSEEKLLAVMVWIHGGGFIEGSSSSTYFNPGFFLNKDIVLVSLNYRLGILGFLSTGDSVAPGNFGMKDQVLALKWVQTNIRNFGGNPNRVTIFGESAGGASTSLHALSPASEGLFHQYIAQSGNAMVPWTYQNRTCFASFVKELGFLLACPAFNSEWFIRCLQTRKVDELLGTSAIFSTLARIAQLTWTPTDEPESEDAFLTDSPENLIAKDEVRDYPFITGNVFNEGLLITELMYTNDFAYMTIRLSLDEIINYFSNYYSLENRKQFKNQVKKEYFSKGFFTSKKEFIAGMTNFANDAFFNYPEVKLIKTLSKKSTSPCYSYNFAYQGRESILKSLQKNYGEPKVGHGDEIYYLFPKPSVVIKGQDKIMSDLMVDLWTSFAINGTPTSNLLSDSDLWKPFKEEQNYLNFSGSILDYDLQVTLNQSFSPKRMQFWQKNTEKGKKVYCNPS